MNRPDDAVGIFWSGIGHRTYGDLKCDFCYKTYNEGADEEEDYDNDGISYDEVHNLNICEHCFSKLEDYIWSRRKDVIQYLIRRTEKLSAQAKKNEEIIKPLENLK